MSDPRVRLVESFDRVATQYHHVRPGYPEVVFDRIAAYANLDAASHLLELGTGTGKATLPFAQRGFSVVGLEPGEDLVRVARTVLAGFPRVQIHCTTFEGWSSSPAAFDLVFAAQSFHWLDPNGRLARIAFALRRPGAVAIFGNSATTAGDPLHERLQAVYAERAPSLLGRAEVHAWYGSADSPVVDELSRSTLFMDVHSEVFPWRQSLSSTEYCELLSTYSDHSTLPASELASLLSAIADVVRAAGDVITLDYRTALFQARAV
jgi:SAM-dependent methyltransferase